MIPKTNAALHNRVTPRRGPRVSYAVLTVFALVLAGCGMSPPSGNTPLRDPGALIGATTRFDPAAFAGTYHLAAELRRNGTVPAPRTNAYFWDPAATSMGVVTSGPGQVDNGVGRFELLGPGRMILTSLSGRENEVWVLWTDADYRTIVLGGPAGDFAEIWDRSTQPSPDRMTAAREILDFNGYDLSFLQEVK